MVTDTGIEVVGEFAEPMPNSYQQRRRGKFEALLAALTAVLEHPDLQGRPVAVHTDCYPFYKEVREYAHAWPLVDLAPCAGPVFRQALDAAQSHAARHGDVVKSSAASLRRRVAATDGSWNKKGCGKWAGYGWADDHGRVGSGVLRGNIVIAELAAIHALLDRTDRNVPLEVLVDSRAALRAIEAMRAGEPVHPEVGRHVKGIHAAFMAELRREVALRDLVFTWVRGHSGNVLNEIADRLAVQARRAQEGIYGTETRAVQKVRANIAADLRDCLSAQQVQAA